METSFYKILAKVQEHMSKNHAALLEHPDSKDLLHSYIAHYLQTEELHIEGYTPETLLTRLVNEMTGYSILTHYLADSEVEEVNVNSWDDIKVNYADGSTRTAPEQFRDVQHGIDVVRRMLRESNLILDNATPTQVGHVSGSLRMTAVAFDIVDIDVGLCVSIRKTKPSTMTTQDFLQYNTATAEMLEFLSDCYNHDVSICFTGATGSGKTTLLAWLLSQVSHDKRLITVEQGTREFDCVVRDRNRRVKNSALHLSTRLSDDAKQSITQTKLMETLMTMNPTCIAVGESKGEEALQVIGVSNTGHAVATTTHANSCEKTYRRFVSLCKLSPQSSDDHSLKIDAVEAFPLVVFVQKLADNTRKILQINEAYCDEENKIHHRVLYRYVITNTIIVDGKVQMSGHFQQENVPSAQLKEQLRASGLPTKRLDAIFNGGNANEFH